MCPGESTRGCFCQNTHITKQQITSGNRSHDTIDTGHELGKEVLVPMELLLNKPASGYVAKEAFLTFPGVIAFNQWPKMHVQV